MLFLISKIDLITCKMKEKEKERNIQKMLPIRRGPQLVTQNSLDPLQSSTVQLITLKIFWLNNYEDAVIIE